MHRTPPHTAWRRGADAEAEAVPNWYAHPDAHDVETGTDEFVLWKGEAFLVVLARRPYNTGHLHLVPVRPAEKYRDLSTNEQVRLGRVIEQAMEWVERALGPEGFNLGFGRRPEEDHTSSNPFYVDLIPRWSGDTNFTVTAHETKVLPETLEETYRRIDAQISEPPGSKR